MPSKPAVAALAFTLLAVTTVAQTRGGVAAVSPAERRAAALIRPEALRAHVRFLAHDLLEGRGPASRGDRLAQLYIATQFEALGLEPGAPGGGYLQPFDLVGVDSRVAEPLRARGQAGELELRPGADFIAFSGVDAPEARLDAAELVFVGYGILAPEYAWDDYKGADLKGKVLLMMNNDPADDPRLFAGKTRLYYGRWNYKYESAARQGAAGAIVVHSTPSAGYGWQVVQTSWTGVQFHLPDREGPQLQVQGWTTEEASKRLAQLGGHDLDRLRADAERRDFRPVPLGVSVSLRLTNDVQRAQTANVIARLPGCDTAVASEAVIYTAHHDHLGVKPEAQPGDDAIYNGALDNASGVAGLLSLAQALKALERVPRRSVLFAAVAAEEQGLLGSEYLAHHLPLPAGRVAANVNIDGLNILGRTRDLPAVGLGKSTVDDYLIALARMQGREIVPDAFPDRGFFYRSDQLNFARIGVPAAYLDQGVEVLGKPPGWGKQQVEKFEATDYHQPSDELRDTWDLAGAVEDLQLLFHLGVKIANSPRKPVWKAGDEFEAARKAALQAIGE